MNPGRIDRFVHRFRYLLFFVAATGIAISNWPIAPADISGIVFNLVMLVIAYRLPPDHETWRRLGYRSVLRLVLFGSFGSATAIVRPPLNRVRWCLCFFSQKTRARVFEPLLADVVHEWFEAELAGRRWEARWVRYVRGPWAVFTHVAAQIPVSLGKLLVSLVKAAL